MEQISSVNNERIKHAASLNDKKFRRFHGAFLVEGEKLVREVARGKGEIITLYVEKGCEARYADIIALCEPNVLVVDPAPFSKIAYTETPQGIIAEVKMREVGAFELSRPFLVLDTIQDPGNLGTIIRTAAAVGFEDIVLLSCVDPFGPKVVRSSSGAVMSVNLISLTEAELLSELEGVRARLYACDMAGESVFSFSPDAPVYGLVIGSEGRGVSEGLRARTDRFISLPMSKRVESLNAAVSASIIMYELKKDEIC